MTGRYVNPYTDFGFKLLFGTPMNKDLLIGFLNALLRDEAEITDVTYLNAEQLGRSEGDRKAVFDVYCENVKGERFIVEMQKARQKFFKDRSVFYSTFPMIREQAKAGDWDYELKSVYTVGILNFVFDEDKDDEEYYHHEVKLMDVERKEVFYDKLTFIYLEMPKMFEKWMFVLKNLATLLDRPAALQERVFKRLFEAAEIARFTETEMKDYEESLKNLRDLGNVLDTAKEEGLKEGLKKGRKEGLKEGRREGLKEGLKEGEKRKSIEIAKNLLGAGIADEVIAASTGLCMEEIRELKS